MSNTKKHKDKCKFNYGLLEELPRDLEKMFDRWNWDVGEFRKAKKDLKNQIKDETENLRINTTPQISL